ncbi:MAG: hypothetical protein KDI06_19320 [Calditrichaeota bacterium]|nr:hypothetical protein [Calditrichota bacterium]HQU73709.1 hypothetical protein [Calditrichia bacterium]
MSNLEEKGKSVSSSSDLSDLPLIVKQQMNMHDKIAFDTSFRVEYQKIQYPVLKLLQKSGAYLRTEASASSDRFQVEGYREKFNINTLVKHSLARPLEVLVEYDGEGYLARTIDLPLHGYGDDPIEAIEMLREEIETVYSELMEDDEFSDEWLNYKKLLNEIIVT